MAENCQCKWCVWDRREKELLVRVPTGLREEIRSLIGELNLELMAVSDDLDYLQAMIDGSWPLRDPDGLYIVRARGKTYKIAPGVLVPTDPVVASTEEK